MLVVCRLRRNHSPCLGSAYLQSPPNAQLCLVWDSILNCPSISVSSINLMAFAAALCSFSISRRSSRPERRPSSWRRSCRYLRHRSSMCDSVWRPSRHGQLASVASGTLRLKRRSLSLIFSVRIWTKSALWCLLSPSCIRRAFLVGLGYAILGDRSRH